MNQDFTTKLIDTFCSSCGYEELRFLHSVWHGDVVRRFCTSCVLLSHKEAFCPTCFDVYDLTLPDVAICCSECHSYSHATCLSSNGSPSKAPYLCLSCINPDRIIFNLRKVKVKGESESYMAMNKKAAESLLTAAKIAAMSMIKAAEALQISAEMIVKEIVIAKKKATGAVNHVMELEDKENNCDIVVGTGNNNDVALLVDSWIHSEEDSSPETLRESGRLQSLTVEGAVSEAQSSRVAMDIDLNEEYPSWNDAV